MQHAVTFRTELLAAGGCSFSAALTVDYDESVSKFCLDCTHTCADGVLMCLTQPQTLQGITARMDESGGSVIFDDTQIALADLADGNLAPMAVPYLLTKCWSESYISLSGSDDAYIRVTYLDGYDEKQLSIDTWFDETTGSPVYAEVSCDGKVLVRTEIMNFSFSKE